MVYPLNSENKMKSAKLNIINILKMEGYKLDSGELFKAFKEAGGEMADFKGALELLTEEGKIKSDNEGNIMTVEDFQREKSQSKVDNDVEINQRENDDIPEEIKLDNDVEINQRENDDIPEQIKVENDEENISVDEQVNENELESIIKLKEETDSWLIEKLKNHNDDSELRDEISSLKERVEKLENIIKNLTKAFK